MCMSPKDKRRPRKGQASSPNRQKFDYRYADMCYLEGLLTEWNGQDQEDAEQMESKTVRVTHRPSAYISTALRPTSVSRTLAHCKTRPPLATPISPHFLPLDGNCTTRAFCIYNLYVRTVQHHHTKERSPYMFVRRIPLQKAKPLPLQQGLPVMEESNSALVPKVRWHSLRCPKSSQLFHVRARFRDSGDVYNTPSAS